jgi:hypothetical protein
MKIRIVAGLAIVFGLALAGLSGCETTSGASQSTQKMLLQAGFKPLSASGQTQIAALGKLRPDHFSTVQRKGKTIYVFPDPANNVLYAGTASNYQQYKSLVQASNLKYTEQQLDDATGYVGNWGSWKSWESDAGRFQN